MELIALAVRALGAPPEEAAMDDRILDGALPEVAAHGPDGTTMDAIARSAGVGRMTVFRRFGSKDALIERLALRELRRFLAEFDASLDMTANPADRIAEAFAACLRAGRDHPLVLGLARREPGAATELLMRGDPSPLDLGRAFVAARLPPDLPDAEGVADVLVRLAVTYVLFPAAWVDLGDDETARDFASRMLAPLVA